MRPSNGQTLKVTSKKRRINPFSRIGLLFLIIGFVALVASLVYDSTILIFAGLGLTLWGGLFFFIKPARYVKSTILSSTAISYLKSIEKILNELEYQGTGIYLPPRSLKHFKESLVFIPSKELIFTPSTEELRQGKVFFDPDGICLISPGQGLLSLYEEQLGVDLAKVNLDYLINNLPKLLVEDMELVEHVEIITQKDMIQVKLKGSIFGDLYNEGVGLKNICSRVGCPVSSSIIGALAKTTGKAVVTEEQERSKDGKTIETKYRLI